jgi:hypothetical protein
MPKFVKGGRPDKKAREGRDEEAGEVRMYGRDKKRGKASRGKGRKK